jgi:hypothetical protein
MTLERTPEQKAKKAAAQRAYRATAKGEAQAGAYRTTAEQKARYAAQRALPEVKAIKAEYNAGWNATEEAKARKRAYRNSPASKAQRRAYELKRTYGITLEQYELILTAQSGKCAICRCTPRTKKLAVDHDHKTKAIRGLLCSNCNHKLLGAAHDKVDILKNAIRYIENPPARSALYAEEGTGTDG